MLEPSSDIALRPYQRDIFSLFSHGLDLKDLDGKCILVLGATGLIGSCIVDTLMLNPNDYDYKVIAAGRNRERAQRKFAAYWNNPHFSFAEIDVTLPMSKNLNGLIFISETSIFFSFLKKFINPVIAAFWPQYKLK